MTGAASALAGATTAETEQADRTASVISATIMVISVTVQTNVTTGVISATAQTNAARP